MVQVSSYRFVVYAPNGRRKGFLVEPSQWSASIPMNDVGALTLSYSPTAPHSDWLHDAVEVSIEAVNPASGEWDEVRSGRYILLEEKADTAKGAADMPSYTLVGYGTLLDKVTGVPAQYAGGRGVYVEGKRHYVNATVGQIMVGFLQEARAVVDGLQPGIELGFTAEKDSRGKPWSTVLDLDYEPSVSMLTALQNLAAQGVCDWWFEGRTLMAVNPDSASVRTQIRLHPDASSEAPIQATRAGLLHTVFLQGEAGVTWRVDNEGALAPWGKTMSVLTQGGVSREATARRLIQAQLDAGSRVRTERTFSANVETLDWTPLVGVTAGDWIHIKTSEGFEAVRIFQVTLRGNGSTVTVGLTLNDRFEDAQVRTAKRLKGITGGASGDAGTSTLPNPSSVKIKPAAVEGLLAQSEGYWKGAQALSLVRASCAAVTSDVHGNPVMIDHYEVTVAGRTVSSKDTVDIVVDGLAPAHEVAVTAVAVSSDGHKSAPTSVKVTTVYPDARLDPPTRLAVTVNTGIVSACWDGKLQADGGAPYTPPAHFDHIRVEESSDQRSWVAVDSMDGISVLDRQDMLGVTLFYRAIAVDRIGNESDPSPISSIVVVNLLGEKIQEALDEAAAAQEYAQQQGAEASIRLGEAEARISDLHETQLPAIETAAAQASQKAAEALRQVDAAQQRADAAFLLADAATTTSEVQTLIRTAANGLNKITYSTAVPSGSGTRSGDTWFRINTANQIIGQWQWTGSAWQVAPITNSVIANLDAGKISSGVIDAARIGADSITADKIAAGAVTAAEIAANAVTAGKIAAGAVTAGKIAAGAVTAGTIAANAVDAAAIKAGSVGASELLAEQATIDKLWTGGIYAKTVETQKLLVTGANLVPNVHGWGSGDKTGWENFGLSKDDAAIWLQGETSQVSSARVTLEPGITYHFSVDVRSSVAGTVYYVALVALDLSGGVPLSVSSSGYLLQNKKVSAASVWEPASASFTVSEPCQARIRIWANHAKGAANTDGYQWFRNLSIRPMVGTTLIEGGAVTTGKIAANAVTAEKITVDQALINKLAVSSLWAGKITTQMLTAGDSYAGSVSVSQAGIKIKGSSSGGVTLTSAGLTAKASDGSTTVRIDQNGNASFKGSIAAGTTIAAPVITGGTISGNIITGSTITGGSVTATTQDNVKIVLSAPPEKNFGGLQILSDEGYTLSRFVYMPSQQTTVLEMFDKASGKVGVKRFSLNGDGIVSWYSPQGRQSLRFIARDSGQYAQMTMIGPIQGEGAYSYLRMGVSTIDGIQARTAGLYTTGDEASRVYIHGAGSWSIGSPQRGHVTMYNDSGEIAIHPRSSLLSFYNLPATTSTGNPITMIVSATGRPSIYKNTSLRKHKVAIEDVTVNPHLLLTVPVRHWYDRLEVKRLGNVTVDGDTVIDGDGCRSDMPLRRIPGVVAEEVLEAGLAEFCSFTEDGELTGVQYDRLPLLLIPLVRELFEKIEMLEKKGT